MRILVIMFSSNEMGIFSKYLNNINLDDVNYNEDDHETIIHVRLLALHSKYEKLKHSKNS